MRKVSWLILLLGGVVAMAAVLNGCATTTVPAQTETLYVPQFSWSPKNTAAAGSARITVAVVNPVYGSSRRWAIQGGFHEFSPQLGVGFEQLLVSKGFTVKGPFDSSSDMTYEDKKESELALEPTLEVSVQLASLTWNVAGYSGNGGSVVLAVMAHNATPVYEPSGEVVIGGRVMLVVFEPLTGEKLWVKNVMIPEKTISFTGTKGYEQYGLYGQQFVPMDASFFPVSDADVGHELDVNLLKDPGIETPIAKALETYFGQILDTADKYVDVAEMKGLEGQSNEIRKKARFSE